MKKILTTFSLYLLFFAASVSFSQPGSWVTVQSGLSVMLQDSYFLNNGLNGWAVGGVSSGGTSVSSLCRTTNGSINWTPVLLNNNSVLTGVFFADALTGWLVGSNGRIMNSTDGGATWVQQNSPTGRTLAKVWFVNSLTGWAAGGWQDGSSYLVVKTTNGGQTWVDQSFSSGAYSCETVFFINDQTGWVGGRDNTLAPQISKTTDGGATWVRQTLPSMGSNIGIDGIRFATTNKGWAATTSINTNGPVLYTSDGGTTWSVQYTTNLHYHVLDIRDSLSVAVVGVKVLSPATETVFITTNGGTNWTASTPPINGYTYAISFRGSNVWIGSNNTQILKGSNNGTSWQTQFTSPRWRSAAWTSPQTGYITAGTSVGTDGTTLKTTDGGTSWNYDNSAPGGSQAFFVNQNFGWMFFEGNSSTIYRTTNAGSNWIQTFIPSGGAYMGRIFFASQNTGWAFGSTGRIVVTTNGGAAWTTQSTGVTNYVEALYFVNETTGWAGGGYGGGSGFILHTTNSGQTWTQQTPSSSAMVYDMYFLNSLTGWALNFGGSSQKTTDGGQTWNPSGSIVNSYAMRIVMLDTLRGWIAAYNFGGGSNGLGYIYRTSNGGDSWAQEWQGTLPSSDLSDLVIQNGTNRLWCVGNNSTVLKYDIPIGVTPESEIVTEYKLMQNYPNPFNPSTEISFAVPKDETVSLKVYDISGRLVSSLVDGEHMKKGSYKIRFDGTQLSSGVYFYEMETGSFNEQKKMILLK